jgi:Ca2+-binding RTX toxin-like protein/GH24 family phage-related lysozyme (muramidase)
MAINYRDSYTQEQYVDAVIKLISEVEGFGGRVYRLNDSKATIGYGYTFNSNDNLSLWTNSGIALTPEEQNILQRIDNATTDEQKTNIAYSQFTRRITKDEARALLRQTYPEYEGPALTLDMSLSPERVALVAVTYNRGEGAVKKNMQDFYQAIRDGNRAEAWFHIRYNSLGKIDQYVNGKAKARYLQSEVFGLYDDYNNVGTIEARSVFQMFQRHRKEIYDYENTYGERFDGRNGTRNMVSEGNNNANYQMVINFFLLGSIDTINQALDSAKTALLADLRTRYQGMPDLVNKLNDSIASTSIYLNPKKATDSNRSYTLDVLPYETGAYAANGSNDLMIGLDQTDTMFGRKGNDILLGEGGDDILNGNEGEDILHGGQGNDKFWGGTGNDTLIGGSGDDSYYYRVGDGNDRIIDTEGDDKIFLEDVDGRPYLLGNVYKTGATSVWTRADGKAEITHNSPWQIVLEDGSTIQLGENFQDGDFGINLNDTPTNPETTNTIICDNEHFSFEDTAANDSIVGTDNQNEILIHNGGIDWALGNGGNDRILAYGSGNVILEGGAGNDKLAGSSGDDKIFADSYGEMEDLVAAGETAESIDELGEDLLGGAGDDFVYGSNKHDSLAGEAGNDLIVGGGGNDWIVGDYDQGFQGNDWDVYQVPNVDQGNDVIYAGTGNDTVYGNDGNDEDDRLWVIGDGQWARKYRRVKDAKAGMKMFLTTDYLKNYNESYFTICPELVSGQARLMRGDFLPTHHCVHTIVRGSCPGDR